MPLLLIPIGTGIILANLPLGELIKPAAEGQSGGFLWYFYKYTLSNELLPLLVFLGLGALTDFEPMLSNPRTILLGAAAQWGVFCAFSGYSRRLSKHKTEDGVTPRPPSQTQPTQGGLDFPCSFSIEPSCFLYLG